jgi:hypothetical protein
VDVRQHLVIYVSSKYKERSSFSLCTNIHTNDSVGDLESTGKLLKQHLSECSDVDSAKMNSLRLSFSYLIITKQYNYNYNFTCPLLINFFIY